MRRWESRHQFLSTLSLRRATAVRYNRSATFPDFYPRSPCGERLLVRNVPRAYTAISIHALLAESDEQDSYLIEQQSQFLSTLSLRRATSLERANSNISLFLSTLSLRRATASACGSAIGSIISIHALLAESDRRKERPFPERKGFLSTLSLRRATFQIMIQLHWLFQFLSTLSLRRATDVNNPVAALTSISIHALLAESDAVSVVVQSPALQFLSTLSLRRATYRL